MNELLISVPTRAPCRFLFVPLVVICALLGGACTSGDDRADGSSSSQPGSTSTLAATADADAALELRPLRVTDGVIVDDLGRQVLLRGANLNSFGEYHQADPEASPTAPVTDADWDGMAANGLSVVRLLMSWSRLEPEPGAVDDDYLDQLSDAVGAANQRGIYVVLDMHQDAWGPHIASPSDVVCEPGSKPAIGWDGAPEWATITGGASTCVTGGRESAPAVKAAFANFYANTRGPDGVGLRDHLAAVWGAVAKRFAGRPGVAGYDLFNEPNPVEPFTANLSGYSAFVRDSISAIRAAEVEAGADPAPVFVEPIVLYPLPDTVPDLPDDPNLVFAPHNYAESIGPKILSVEQTYEVDQVGADRLGTALWIGEYGFWSTEPDRLAVAARLAAEEDRRMLGGAWWQWRQTCGDPHSVGSPGGRARSDQVHLNTVGCPGDRDLGPTEAFLSILGRSYPRSAPGRLSSLASDPSTGSLSLAATGATLGSELVVWVRVADGDTEPQVSSSTGLDDTALTAVPGGLVLTATATSADYTLALDRP